MSVISVSPPGYAHTGALAEVAETLRHGLRRIDYDGPPMVVGAHLLPEDLPVGAIIYNTEHVASSWFTQSYRNLLQAYEVWDYSAVNAAALSELLGKPIKHVPLGYVPELTRIEPTVEQDIDVLFYGSINERRQAILDQLRKTGLAVTHAFGVYGADRDALIARAKVVLNLHYYLPGHFEAVRVSYLMANCKAVVCEQNPGEGIDADLMEGIATARYDELAAECRYWVDGDADRQELEEMAFLAFAARDMSAILRQALMSRTVSGSPTDLGICR